jgi:hypothetical protein
MKEKKRLTTVAIEIGNTLEENDPFLFLRCAHNCIVPIKYYSSSSSFFVVVVRLVVTFDRPSEYREREREGIVDDVIHSRHALGNCKGGKLVFYLGSYHDIRR